MPRPRVRPSKTQLADDLANLGTVRAVAGKYGVHETTVSRWKRQHNLPRNTVGSAHWAATLDDHEAWLARELIGAGLPYKEIADKMEVSLSVVQGLATENTYRNVADEGPRV